MRACARHSADASRHGLHRADERASLTGRRPARGPPVGFKCTADLSRTLSRLAVLGFVKLQKRPGNVVRPVAEAVKYSISADYDIVADASTT